MGQAFDDKGNVLGEAFGQTKREVFDKLIGAHPSAAEIRIRSLSASLGAPDGPWMILRLAPPPSVSTGP